MVHVCSVDENVHKTSLARESYLWSTFSSNLNFISDFKLTYKIIPVSNFQGGLLEHR